MRKRIVGILLCICVGFFWMTGCSSEESADTKKTDVLTAGTEQKVETSKEELPTGGGVTSLEEDGQSEEERLMNVPLSEMQKRLGVTMESRKEFVEKYGIEEYEQALNVVPYFILSSTNADTPILESDTKMYREGHKIETITIPSSMEDRHEIPADYVTDGNRKKDTVILVHGCGENRRKLFWRTTMFLEFGYNVVQYDQRSSGDNKAPYVTYGVLEKFDLYDCIQYVAKQNGGHKIGVYGSSMGGLTVIKLLSDSQMADKVDFGILDCPLVRMQDRLNRGLDENCPKQYRASVQKSVEDFLPFFYGFTIEDTDGYLFAEQIKTPVLMFASEKDAVLSCDQQKEFYKRLGSKEKYLFVSKTAAHCCVAADDEKVYAELTKEILNGTLFKHKGKEKADISDK